ncbi:MAG: 4-phosphoerythronate dehydrogenase [Bacteroidota bacterium]
MLRLLADANIPFAERLFGPFGTVRLCPGRDITREALRETDVLLVRSVTPVDADLLGGTPVRFVGTATAGVDHVDREALRRLGVAFASAPGSNAASVVDYGIAALLAVAADRGESLEGKTLGVVGAGQVGGRLVPRARALGMRVVASDPPLAEARPEHSFVPLAMLLSEADVVTLHTPLTAAAASAWPTRDLLGAEAFAAMKPGAWLVNAARGGVVSAPALRREVGRRPCVLDVWPNEPTPDLGLVRAATFGTPHIAGYALDGKVRGATVLADALRAWHPEAVEVPEPEVAPGPVIEAPDLPAATASERTAWLDALARQAYDLRADDARFRDAMLASTTEADQAVAFARLRKDHPVRREWSRIAVRDEVPPPLLGAVADGLGMRVASP